MIPPRSEDWEFKLAEQGLDLVKAPTEEEIKDGPIMNHEANFIVEAADFNDVEQSWDKTVQQNPRTEIHSKDLLSDLDQMGDNPENHPVMKKVMGKLLEVATHHDLGLVDSDQAKHVIRHARKHGQLVEKLMDHLQQATIAKAFHSTAKEILGPEDEKGWGKILDRSITDGCASWHEMHHQLHHDCKKNCGYWGIPKGEDCTFCKHGCPFCDQDDPGRFASIKKAEGLAGSNDQLYLDPMFTGAGDGNTGPSIKPTPLTDQGTSTETLEKKSSWVLYANDLGAAPAMPPAPTSPPSVSSSQGDVQIDTATGQRDLIAPPQGQAQQYTPSIQQLQQQDAANTPAPTTPTPKPKTPAKPSGGGINWLGDIVHGVEIAGGIGLLAVPGAEGFGAAAIAQGVGGVIGTIKKADGDENIPGSTQPSLGQNESTMERSVTLPINMTGPSKQTSDRGTTPQTNSKGNVNSPSVLDRGQEANMENPAMQAMAPEGNGNIIMTGNWKSTDYLNSIKEASDSEIYFRGFADGRSGMEMDKSLSNLSDDYFNGWQDGKIYVHLPIEEVTHNLVDMKPGANAAHMAAILPGEGLTGGHEKLLKVLIGTPTPDEHQLHAHAKRLGVDKEELRDFLYGEPDLPRIKLKPFKFTASVDTECEECNSVRIAHCGTCEGSSKDLKETTENVEGPAADAKDTQNMQVAGSASCKNCYGSGIVCMDCGCSR